MNPIDKNRLTSFHQHLVQENGVGSPQSLGFTDSINQELRFEVISAIAKMDNSSVLDLGCGYADLKAFLDQRYENVDYTGVELLSEFVEVALEKYHGAERFKLINDDFDNIDLPQVDYVLSSGSLSYYTEESDALWKMIEKMFATCRKGLAFNLLDKVEFRRSILREFDPNQVLEFCYSIAPTSCLLQHYLPGDFTLYLYKR